MQPRAAAAALPAAFIDFIFIRCRSSEPASERANERAGWHPLSPESPAADYGCLCSAHIKRPLTPLLCCLLSSPPLNPHPPAAMNGMMKISIEFKRMRSDHPTTVFVQQPPTRVGVLAPSCDAAVSESVFSLLQHRYIHDDRKPD